MFPKLLIDVTARSAGHTGAGRWVDGFCKHLASRGIAYHEISAATWASSTGGLLGQAARLRGLREVLYYTVGLRKASTRYERVLVLDNIARLMFPLPAAARPFYLIHDLIPLEMSGRFVMETMGWRAALAWTVSRRFYQWRLKRILFAPEARFGYVSRATEAAAYAVFGRAADRGVWIGPMMQSVAANDTSSCAHAQRVPSEPYVLALGTGDPKKGLESLLKAWCEARIGERFQLVLFGASWKGKGHRWIDSSIRESGVTNVAHLGSVSDATLRRLYRDAAAFVFPSYFEGLGLPPAEYCLEGSGQLILRDIPVLRELYGDVACFFSTREDLVALLRRLADDRVDAPITPELRRQKVRARLDAYATFERLLAAVLSESGERASQVVHEGTT